MEFQVSGNILGMKIAGFTMEECQWPIVGYSSPTSSIQILNVMVHNPEHRRTGFGSQMISDIRCAFPNTNIWVDTWNCSEAILDKDDAKEKD
jgi:hypothetical protein